MLGALAEQLDRPLGAHGQPIWLSRLCQLNSRFQDVCTLTVRGHRIALLFGGHAMNELI